MTNMFNEDGTYNKTNWKAGDKITANKLNKIEESLEAINNNDISRHVEADTRLDALEEQAAGQNEVTNERIEELNDLVLDNKDELDLEIYDINSRMTFLEEELNEGIEEVNNVASTVDGKINECIAEVNNVASTVDGKIATAEANMAAQVNTAKDEMTAQVDQGKADMEAMVAEVEDALIDVETNSADIATLRSERIWKRITGLISNDQTAEAAESNRTILTSWVGTPGKNAIIPPGTYYIDQPIYYAKECHIEGCGWTYGGTCIVPLGDFSAFVPDPDQSIDFTRNTFKNFRIHGKNVTTAVGGIEFKRSFLTNVEDVFFHDCGCSFEHSDSIMFNMCKFMDYDTSHSCTAVDIGTGSRSIHFNECNFEIGTSSGRARIYVDSAYAGVMQIINSQFERANVHIRDGKNVVIRDCKGEDLYIGLSPKTAFCTIQDVNCPSTIHDFGHRNNIINHRGVGTHWGVTSNIKIDEHSSMIPESDNIWKSTDGKELLFISAICPTNSTSLADAGIVYKDAVTDEILAQTYTTNVPVNLASSIGYNRISFNTFYTLVAPSENGIKTSSTSSAGSPGYTRFVYENLLTNGTFSNNTALTGWSKRYPDSYTSITHTEGVSTKITSGDDTHAGGIYQSVALKANHTYMLLCSFKSGTAGFGQMWDGTVGVRPSVAFHKLVEDPEMDGFYLASAYYTAVSNGEINISIASINPADTTEIRWIALIDITDWSIKSLG